MFSPRTRSLNSVSRSSTTTSCPAFANCSASADPPSPPPTMIASRAILHLTHVFAATECRSGNESSRGRRLLRPTAGYFDQTSSRLDVAPELWLRAEVEEHPNRRARKSKRLNSSHLG